MASIPILAPSALQHNTFPQTWFALALDQRTQVFQLKTRPPTSTNKRRRFSFLMFNASPRQSPAGAHRLGA